MSMADTDYVSASIFRIIDQGCQSSEIELSLTPDFSEELERLL